MSDRSCRTWCRGGRGRKDVRGRRGRKSHRGGRDGRDRRGRRGGRDLLDGSDGKGVKEPEWRVGPEGREGREMFEGPRRGGAEGPEGRGGEVPERRDVGIGVPCSVGQQRALLDVPVPAVLRCGTGRFLQASAPPLDALVCDSSVRRSPAGQHSLDRSSRRPRPSRWSRLTRWGRKRRLARMRKALQRAAGETCSAVAVVDVLMAILTVEEALGQGSPD